MKVHVFDAVKQGWAREHEGVWFNADMYSKEEAQDEFVKVEKTTWKNNDCYPYTAYEYDGQLYYSIRYMGLYDYDNLPEHY